MQRAAPPASGALDGTGRPRDRMAMMSAQPWEPRLARLEGAYEQIDRRLGDLASHVDAGFAQMESRFAQVDARLDARFGQIDARFGQVDGRIGALERKVDTAQWRFTALVVGTWATTILTILFHH